jgi:hypothetical protein
VRYCSKDGAFEESLNAVHGLMNVNTDNSYRARCEDIDGACDSGHSACGAPFAVNGNNRLLWEVRIIGLDCTRISCRPFDHGHIAVTKCYFVIKTN